MLLSLKYLPFAVLLPSFVLWGLFLYRVIDPAYRATVDPQSSVSLVVGFLAVHLLAFATSVAMILVQPERKIWRYVAAFNGLPYLAAAVFAPFAG